MVEDTPNDLVHDIAAEAVFGAHPLGRPVIGTRGGHLDASRAARSPAYHRRAYSGEKIVARGGRERPPRRARRAARRASRTAPRPARASRARKPARAEPDAGRPLPAQGHGAVPRLPQRAGNLAPRRAPLRRLAHGRDRRRLGVVAALPGDPREARDGVLGLQLLVAVRRRGADRRLRRHARGQPRRVPRDRGRRALGHRARATCAATSSRARRRTSRGGILLSLESTSARMTRLGKSTITDTPLLDAGARS